MNCLGSRIFAYLLFYTPYFLLIYKIQTLYLKMGVFIFISILILLFICYVIAIDKFIEYYGKNKNVERTVFITTLFVFLIRCIDKINPKIISELKNINDNFLNIDYKYKILISILIFVLIFIGLAF